MFSPNYSLDNVSGVMWLAIKETKTKVTRTDLLDYLYAHPYYPTLKSVCDGFSKWSIDNYALELSIAEVLKLQKPFIAHLNIGSGQIVLVKRISKGKVWFSFGNSRIKSDTVKNFNKTFSGVVIVFECGKESIHKNYADSRQMEILEKAVIPSFIVFVFLSLLLQVIQNKSADFLFNGWRVLILFFTKTFGIVISMLLILHELKISSPLVDKICHLNKNTDCNAVLNSQSSKIYGWIGWADFGIIYFIGTLGFLLMSETKSDLNLLALLSLLSIPYPIYSIYTQAFRIKKFCPLCLTVQVFLLAEFIILLPQFDDFSLTIQDSYHMFTWLSLIGLLYLMVRFLNKYMVDYGEMRKKYLRFKSNPVIFRDLFLRQEEAQKESIPDQLVLGNVNADITVNAFLSLYCQPCAKAFSRLAAILKERNEIRVNIIIIGKEDHLSIDFIETVYKSCSINDKDKAIKLLLGWYNSLLKNSLSKGDTRKLVTDNGQILKENQELFKKFNISGTPTIMIGNRKLPTNYNINDLEYYIDDIRQLLTEKKEAGGYIAN